MCGWREWCPSWSAAKRPAVAHFATKCRLWPNLARATARTGTSARQRKEGPGVDRSPILLIACAARSLDGRSDNDAGTLRAGQMSGYPAHARSIKSATRRAGKPGE